MYRQRVLFFDIDQKDFPNILDAKMAVQLIKDKFPNLFIHACYFTGHGFQIFVSMDTTVQVQRLNNLNKKMVQCIGSDSRACCTTQLSRVPTTRNHKEPDMDDELPLVLEVFHYKNNLEQTRNYHSYSIPQINNMIKKEKKSHSHPRETIDGEDSCPGRNEPNFNLIFPPCIQNAFEYGVEKGERNTFLGRIITELLYCGFSKEEIKKQCIEWNNRCHPPKSQEEIENEINGYFNFIGAYNLNGCWWSIRDERQKNIVRKYCDETQCFRASKNKDRFFDQGLTVRIPSTLITMNRMRKGTDMSLSGQDLLILTVLYKEIRPRSRKIFLVEDLKINLQKSEDGSGGLCMDPQTLKKSLVKLSDFKYIELIQPEPEFTGDRISFNEMIIKIPSNKQIKGDNYIEFYYSTVKALINGDITYQDFKVFLCLINNLRGKRSCTLESLNDILHMGISNISSALHRLEKAHCIEITCCRNVEGKTYNLYSQKNSD